MGKYKNLTIQLNNRINNMLAIGESKHAAKEVYRRQCNENNIKWNPAKSNFIHSIKTASAYRQTVGEFCSWLKEDKKDIWDTKDIGKIDKSTAYEYLRYREERGCSAYTVSKDMSALNKVLGYDLNKKEGNLKERSYKDVTRSRLDSKEDTKYNPKNYSNQIEFARAFGLRRESIYGGSYQVKDISLFKNTDNDKVYCSVIEKGGRYREAPCLSSYQGQIEQRYNIEERQPLEKEEFIDLYNKSNDLLFDKYTEKIDNHAFRGEYARALYNEIAENKDEIKTDYRGYDKDIVLEVSDALGHNRPSVVVEHYLR